MVIDASPDVFYGSVQTDTITILYNNNEYFFTLETDLSGTTNCKFNYSDINYDKFIKHFNLNENEYVLNDNLLEIVQVNSEIQIGEEYNVDGFYFTISDFSNDGGFEIGLIETIIDDIEIDFHITQYGNGGSDISFKDISGENNAKNISLTITDELHQHLSLEYDRICREKR